MVRDGRLVSAAEREAVAWYRPQLAGPVAIEFDGEITPGRTSKDWTYFLTLVGGDTSTKNRRWGKTSTVRSWLKQGFATGDPASCNTWTAVSAKVA